MAWSKQSANILQQVGLTVVPTLGDGHCILHAIRRSWQVQTCSPVPSVEVMLSEIYREALVNNWRYKDFFCGPYRLYKEQMYAYLYNKVFDTKFVDLLPLIICNSLRISLSITNEYDDGHVDFIDVVPSCNQSIRHTIYVHRKLNHYSALEIISCRGPPSVPTTSVTNEWTDACSGRRVRQRVPPSRQRDATVAVNNRFAGLRCEDEFPPLPSMTEGKSTKKASTPKPKKSKSKCSTSKKVDRKHLVHICSSDLGIEKSQTEKTNEVIVIGTSLVRNLGALLNKKNVDAIVYTHAGCSIQHIAPRFKQMIPANFRGCVILQVGGNDCSSHDSEYVVNVYDSFIADIHSHAPDAHIMVSAIPPRRGSDYLKYKINTVNEYLSFMATFETHVSFIDCPLMKTNHFAKDGVHFSPQGRTIYANNLTGAIKQVFRYIHLNLISR